jgi:hypothetical protein
MRIIFNNNKISFLLFSLILLIKMNGYTQISRTQIINNAIPYTTFSWTASSCNLWNGTSCGGRNVYAANNGGTKSWVRVGTNVSMPYCWGGFSSQSQHTTAMSNCKSAGDICSTAGGSCSSQGSSGAGLSCASGLDCSGLVSRAWGLTSHKGTGELPGLSTSIGITDMQPGDIFNDVGNHTRLLQTNYGNGNYQVIESSGTDWKTSQRTYSTNSLTGYTPLCPNSSIVIGGCGTICTPPSNDVCSSSVPTLNVSTSCSSTSGDIRCATQSYSASGCASGLIQDVWYKFTASANGTYTVRLAPSSSMDGVVEVRQGSCTGTVLGCADVGGGAGATENLNVSVTNGTTYYVRVYDYNSSGNTTPPSTTSFNICVIGATINPPSNDGCNGNFTATNLNVNNSCNYISGSTTDASNSGFPACSGTADDDVFYSFVANSSTQTISVQSGSGFDAVFQLLTGPCGSNMQAVSPGCIDATATSSLETQTYTGLTSGATYFIRVWHYSSGSGTGNFQICVYGSSTPNPGSFTLTATPECNGTTTQIRLNWTTSSNATSYDIYRNGSLYASGVTGLQYLNTAVTAGTGYTYYVVAKNTSGSTNNSNGTLSATALNCSTPTPGSFTLTATPECNGTTTQIRLNWTISSNATSYSIYKNGVLYDYGITNTQYIDYNVTTGVSYSYFVIANNSNGSTYNTNGTLYATAINCSTPNSFTLSVTPQCLGTTSEMLLTWSSAYGATSYNVYKNGTLYSSGVAGIQFVDNNISAGNTYNYFVEAINSIGSTYNSNGTLYRTALNCFTSCTAPSYCTASIGTPANGIKHHTTILCGLSSSVDAIIYEYSFNGTYWYSWPETTSTTFNVDNGDNPNTPFYYRVRTRCGSQYSNYVYADPQPIYTACDYPESPSFVSLTSNTISFDLLSEYPVSNPSSTTYAMYCFSHNKYVQQDGTLGFYPFYQRKLNWGRITIRDLQSNTYYCFYALAQNNQGDIRYSSGNYYCATTDISTGIINSSNEDNIKIYPNPNNGIFIIECRGIKNTEVDLIIYNLIGQNVYNEKINKLFNEKINKQLNLKDLPKGVYYLKLEFGGEFITEKFIIN